MRHYLSENHIDILHAILPYIPKYDTFNLEHLSKIAEEIGGSHKDDWSYILSKVSAVHQEVFTDLWLNGFFEPVDREKGIYKLTPDGQKLKDIGNYDKYLEQVNAEYEAKRSEIFLKKHWYLSSLLAFILGLLTKYLLDPPAPAKTDPSPVYKIYNNQPDTLSKPQYLPVTTDTTSIKSLSDTANGNHP